MISSDLVRAVVVAVLAAIDATGHLSVSVLLVLAVGVGLAAFVGTGVQERFLSVGTDTAVIEAPLYRLKAPAGGAVAAVALLFAAADAARGARVERLPAGAFALLPPLAFTLQELLELSLHTGTLAWHAFLAPTFLPGLLLQLPFALAAYVAARLLLRAARRLGRALATRPPRPVAVASPVTHRAGALPPRPGVAAARLAKRGPPLAVGA
jgi:hypothetical protein